MYRRSYERFEVNAPVTLTMSQSNEEKLMLHDISARGIGVFGDSPLKADEKVTIAFQIPNLLDSPVCTQARIVWSRKVNEKCWMSGLDFGLDNMLNLVNKSFPPAW